jgi:hypothetical protein
MEPFEETVWYFSVPPPFSPLQKECKRKSKRKEDSDFGIICIKSEDHKNYCGVFLNELEMYGS